MSASMIEEEFTAPNAVDPTTRRTEMPTPMSAAISGMPAARNEPRVSRRTMKR